MVEELHKKDNNSSKSLNYNNQVIHKLELTSQEVMLLNSLEFPNELQLIPHRDLVPIQDTSISLRDY